jgi:phosphopantetheinyl transferase
MDPTSYSIENSTDSRQFGKPLICLKTSLNSKAQPLGSLGRKKIQQMPLALSHCGNLAAIAFSPYPWIEIGIDIEKVAKRSKHFAQWVFSEYEKIQLDEILVSNPGWTDVILNLGWAVKEAIGKMTGRGLVDALKTSRIEFKDLPIQFLMEFVSIAQSVDFHCNSMPFSFGTSCAGQKIKIHLQLLKIKSELYVLSLAHFDN